MDNMNRQNSHQMRQIELRKKEQMRRIQEMHELKKRQLMSRVKRNPKLLRDAVIKPIKLNQNNMRELDNKVKNAEKTYKPVLNRYWNTRTNQPYKNIIKDRKHIDKFINKKQIDEKELVVHKVTEEDKKGVEKKLKTFEGNLEKHNDELKVIYSSSKKTEHLKKFKYNHVSKYRIKHNSTSHKEMKKDRIEQFKKEQKKIHKGEEEKDAILETLVNTGFIKKKEQLSELEAEKEKYRNRQKK